MKPQKSKIFGIHKNCKFSGNRKSETFPSSQKIYKTNFFVNKKAILAIRILIVFAILIVTAFVVLNFFSETFAKGTKELKKGFPVEYDDGDTIQAFFDKCPCKEGKEEHKGCPDEDSIPKTPEEIKQARKCLDSTE